MADPVTVDGHTAFEAQQSFDHTGVDGQPVQYVVNRSYAITTDNQDVVVGWADEGKIHFND